VLTALKKGDSVVVRDRTFEPVNFDEFHLETGESIFWIQDHGDMWMAIDESSEEAILFHQVDADVEFGSESVFYSGDDYELSFEASATVVDEDGTDTDTVELKDYETNDGQLFRMIEFEVVGDVMTLVGRKVAEEEFKKA